VIFLSSLDFLFEGADQTRGPRPPPQTSSNTAFAAEYEIVFNAVLPCLAIGDTITVKGEVYDYTQATKRFHIKVNHCFTLCVWSAVHQTDSHEKVAFHRVEGSSRVDAPHDDPLV
jgi:hypothetical protein